MTGTMQGRRILIAGGAAGIGRATARLCLDEGAEVAVIDRNPWKDDDGAEKPVISVRADVRSTAGVEAAVASVAQRLGSLDGVVYCAGVDLVAKLPETLDKDWEQVFDVNMFGAMRVCRAALAHFAPQGGTIVLVASAAGLRPLSERTAYCASKAALVMFAKTLAIELAPRGVRVNALCPGAVETALFRSSFENDPNPDERRAEIEDRYALRRIADPKEMATSILFLSSAASSYVTGSALAADGGRSFH
jgi:NAD(P)-dependent dehydrogenase (short-subunit alcohol dehydrogenase family)